jgi:hypothetical protein
MWISWTQRPGSRVTTTHLQNLHNTSIALYFRSILLTHINQLLLDSSFTVSCLLASFFSVFSSPWWQMLLENVRAFIWICASIGRIPPILKHKCYSSLDISRIPVKLRLVTGTYVLQTKCIKYYRNETDPTCLLCGAAEENVLLDRPSSLATLAEFSFVGFPLIVLSISSCNWSASLRSVKFSLLWNSWT